MLTLTSNVPLSDSDVPLSTSKLSSFAEEDVLNVSTKNRSHQDILSPAVRFAQVLDDHRELANDIDIGSIFFKLLGQYDRLTERERQP